MTCWCTRALVPTLALLLLNWSMTCSRGHALFHEEEHDHADHAHAPHHHGPFEHTHHTEPGDPDHTTHKPVAGRHVSTWRLDLQAVLLGSSVHVGSAVIDDVARPGGVHVVPVDTAASTGPPGRRLILRTERWRA
jgi:hypothetical protein